MSELDRVARTANLDAGPTPSTEEFFTQKESLAISLGDLKCSLQISVQCIEGRLSLCNLQECGLLFLLKRKSSFCVLVAYERGHGDVLFVLSASSIATG